MWTISIPLMLPSITPMLVILCAALISGTAATTWFAWIARREPVREEAVVKRETDLNS
ncbi:MAG TPA: hypothetical protein VG759_00885 [Candidatus Angelobacter sp.]|nr:hypothetical protein [Candidatus Angelobacter sp.]